MALFEQVKEVIVRELSVPESWVTESATFEGDLKADSPEDDAQQIQTVGDAVRYLEEKSK